MAWEDRSNRIAHDGPDLLWGQVAADLAVSIDRGELATGAKLPGEVELAEIYGVARVTVRRAIVELREQGRVTVTVGRGTYVTRPSPH